MPGDSWPDEARLVSVSLRTKHNPEGTLFVETHGGFDFIHVEFE